MRQTAQYHEVTSVTIGKNERTSHGAYRDVIITMRDGEKIRLTVFADGALVPVVREEDEAVVKMMNGEEA